MATPVVTLTLSEFKDRLRAQSVEHLDLAFKCPMCHTIQSARDLIAAGAGADFAAVEPHLGFSCVGRFTGAGSPSKQTEGRGCNWTLGGLFRTHTLVVLSPDGSKHQCFEPCTPEEAQEHARRHNTEASEG